MRVCISVCARANACVPVGVYAEGKYGVCIYRYV